MLLLESVAVKERVALPEGEAEELSVGENTAEEVNVWLGEEDTLSLALRECISVLEDKDEEAVAVADAELDSLSLPLAEGVAE